MWVGATAIIITGIVTVIIGIVTGIIMAVGMVGGTTGITIGDMAVGMVVAGITIIAVEISGRQHEQCWFSQRKHALMS